MWKNLSIKFKIIIICISLAVIPLITLSIIINYSFTKTMYNEVKEKITSEVNAYKIITDSYIKLFENQKTMTDKQSKFILDTHRRYIEEYIYSSIKNKRNNETIKDYISSLKIGQTGYVYILDYEGNYIVSKDRKRDGENLWLSKDSNNNFFIQNIISKGKKLNNNEIDYEIYFWKNAGDSTAREKIAEIIHVKEMGWIIGIGTYYDELIDIDYEKKIIDELSNKIKNVKVGLTGYMYVLNSKGDVVIHPDSKTQGLNLYKYDFVKDIINKKNGYIEYVWQDKLKIASFAYYEPKDWIICSSAYKSDFTSSINKISILIFFICFIIIILSIIVSLLFSGSLIRPIMNMLNTAQKISDGMIIMDIVNINSNDEIGKMSKSFNKMIDSLKYKMSMIKEISEGNFQIEIELSSNNDELGKSLNTLLDSLNNLVGQVNGAVEQVASGAYQVACASQSLSQGATEQASSLEEITSSLTEISSQVKQNTDNAVKANDFAKQSMEIADKGNIQMQELIKAMFQINKSTDEIIRVVKVIDDIAFQTNLLALNANVEAARAGKYGKGFTVVAEEVRNLAKRSAVSVKETTSMVENTINNINNINTLVEVTAKQLKQINDSANKVAELVEEITSASKEQTEGLNQINNGLIQIEQVTQSNTASAEESASASEELSGQSLQLKNLVAKFKLKDQKTDKILSDNINPQLLKQIQDKIKYEKDKMIIH